MLVIPLRKSLMACCVGCRRPLKIVLGTSFSWQSVLQTLLSSWLRVVCALISESVNLKLRIGIYFLNLWSPDLAVATVDEQCGLLISSSMFSSYIWFITRGSSQFCAKFEGGFVGRAV